MSDLSSCNFPVGLYPAMFCSEMRCSCSQQTFILSISFNHIPSIEKSVPFYYTIAKTMFFFMLLLKRLSGTREGCRSLDVKWPGSVMGWGQKNPQGFNENQIIFLHPSPAPSPPLTHTQRETNKQKKKQKEKVRSLMKPHSHKKNLVKFPNPKNKGIRKPQPKNPSITPVIWNPDFPRVTGSILTWFASFIKTGGVLSVVVLFWHISMIYCF